MLGLTHSGKSRVNPMIDLRSDTVTKPSPGMREAMARAEEIWMSVLENLEGVERP